MASAPLGEFREKRAQSCVRMSLTMRCTTENAVERGSESSLRAVLSKGMRQLNGVYTQTFNRKHHRVGHVFQGRYKAIHVEKEAYLLELARYIVLNPVRAEMVRSAKDWPWSSYRSTAGQSPALAWLNTECLLAAFGRTKARAVEGYKQFVSEGKNQPSPWRELRNQVYIGSDAFMKELDGLIDGDKRFVGNSQLTTPWSVAE